MKSKEWTITKFKSFRGHDGDDTAWQCDLKWNGKVVCYIIDDGWGGGLSYEWTNKDAEKAFDEMIKNHPPIKVDLMGNGLPETMTMDGDIYISDLVSQYEWDKKLRTLCRNYTLISIEGDNPETYRKVKAKFTPEVKTLLMQKYPNIVKFWNEEVR